MLSIGSMGRSLTRPPTAIGTARSERYDAGLQVAAAHQSPNARFAHPITGIAAVTGSRPDRVASDGRTVLQLVRLKIVV
jgi:hypothetical protein